MSADIVLVRVERERIFDDHHPRHIHPPLDLFYIRSALTQQTGTSTVLLDGWLDTPKTPPLLERILALQPKIVVIRAMTWCLNEACQLASELRKKGLVTVAVGEQVTHQAVLLEPSIAWEECWDVPVLGEPEQAVPQLIKQLLSGQAMADLAPQYWIRLKSNQPFQVEMPEHLPAPVFQNNELAAYPFPLPVPGRVIRRWGYVMSGWGCPYQCKHCTEVVRKSVGRNLRLRNPVGIVDEIEQLQQQGAQGIAFEDDTLFCNPGHLLAICHEIKRRGLKIRWMANARPDELDEARVAAAASAGAVLLKLGIESGSPLMIEKIGKSRSGLRWLDQVRSGVGLLKCHGIASVGLFMLGMPEETEEEVLATISLAKGLDTDYVQVQRFTAYPDVVVTRDESVIATSQANIYHYADSGHALYHMTAQRLDELHRAFYTGFYFRPAFMLRHLRLFWRWYISSKFLVALPGKLNYLMRLKRLQISAGDSGEWNRLDGRE